MNIIEKTIYHGIASSDPVGTTIELFNKIDWKDEENQRQFKNLYQETLPFLSKIEDALDSRWVDYQVVVHPDICAVVLGDRMIDLSTSNLRFIFHKAKLQFKNEQHKACYLHFKQCERLAELREKNGFEHLSHFKGFDYALVSALETAPFRIFEKEWRDAVQAYALDPVWMKTLSSIESGRSSTFAYDPGMSDFSKLVLEGLSLANLSKIEVVESVHHSALGSTQRKRKGPRI